jgi:hypothetical protein
MDYSISDSSQEMNYYYYPEEHDFEPSMAAGGLFTFCQLTMFVVC